MDKDSVILRYDQLEVERMSKEVEEINNVNSSQENELSDMQAKVAEIYAMIGKTPKKVVLEKTCVEETYEDEERKSYDDWYETAKETLVERGLDVETIDFHDLVSEEELNEIIDELNRPMSKRKIWTKADFIVVFIAASIGSLADIILGDRNNKFTGKNSDFSKWLNEFHEKKFKHASNAPIDFQGSIDGITFGGGYHRDLSKGHDILRFIEAISMFKNGKFEAIRYVNGLPVKVVSTVNQYGNPYEQLSLIEAICNYSKHMLSDLTSTYSLPFPGSSFLFESKSRTLRKFSCDMYQNGFNIKNVLSQGLSTAIIEIIVRLYYSINAVKEMSDEIEISEDYSNFDKVKEFFKPEDQEKLNEMLLVSHAIVTAINVGKIVINKKPWEINVTEIVSVLKYGSKVVNQNKARNNELSKLLRNSEEIHSRWKELEEDLITDELYAIESITDSLIIA